MSDKEKRKETKEKECLGPIASGAQITVDKSNSAGACFEIVNSEELPYIMRIVASPVVSKEWLSNHSVDRCDLVVNGKDSHVAGYQSSVGDIVFVAHTAIGAQYHNLDVLCDHVLYRIVSLHVFDHALYYGQHGKPVLVEAGKKVRVLVPAMSQLSKLKINENSLADFAASNRFSDDPEMDRMLGSMADAFGGFYASDSLDSIVDSIEDELEKLLLAMSPNYRRLQSAAQMNLRKAQKPPLPHGPIFDGAPQSTRAMMRDVMNRLFVIPALPIRVNLMNWDGRSPFVSESVPLSFDGEPSALEMSIDGDVRGTTAFATADYVLCFENKGSKNVRLELNSYFIDEVPEEVPMSHADIEALMKHVPGVARWSKSFDVDQMTLPELEVFTEALLESLKDVGIGGKIKVAEQPLRSESNEKIVDFELGAVDFRAARHQADHSSSDALVLLASFGACVVVTAFIVLVLVIVKHIKARKRVMVIADPGYVRIAN